MKLIKLFLGLILVGLIGLILLGGYMGFIPFLSDVLATQRDLGVEVDPAYFSKTATELNVVTLSQNDEEGFSSVVYAGSISVDKSLSGSEASSVIAHWESVYPYAKYTPFENVQIRVHEDGKVEMSAILNVQKGIDIAKEIGYTSDQINVGLKYARFVTSKVPFYVAGKASMENNRVSMQGEVLEIGRVKVPDNILRTVEKAAESIIEDRISMIPNLNVESIEMSNSQIHVKAQIPEAVTGTLPR